MADPKSQPPLPSTSTTGFFQSRPTILNQFHEDTALRRSYQLFLPSRLQQEFATELSRFASYVLSAPVLRYAQDSARNEPSVQHFDTFGNRVDILTTSEGWRASTATAAREGIVSLGYEKRYGRYARVYQFLKTHLWSASSCGVTCPEAMQDGAAALLTKCLSAGEVEKVNVVTRKVLGGALERLLSRVPDVAWTSGQWMTERPGGSDVRNTETRARRVSDEERESQKGMVASDGNVLGPWRIDGFKWFSSATDADCTVLLAKTDSSNNVSAFFAPTRLRSKPSVHSDKETGSEAETVYNGIQIQRLKSKLGTKSLPTAELVLSGMRAHMIGEEGRGVKEISSILNITRVHTGVGSCGGWGRGLAISRAYSRVRKVNGRLLMDVPSHVKGLAEQMVEYRAKMMMCYFTVSLLGVVEHRVTNTGSNLIPGHEEAMPLLRLLTPVLKSQVSLASIAGLRFCMESLGGIGYLENDEPDLNVARIFRDTCVNSIWEGTTDVLAADTVRVLKGAGGQQSLSALKNWVTKFLQRAEGWRGSENVLQTDIATLVTLSDQVDALERMVATSDADDLLYNGRRTMEDLAWLVSAVLLYEDAMRDSDAVACEIARRWRDRRRPRSSSPASKQELGDWRQSAAWDRKIVFGEEHSDGLATARL